MISGAVFDPTRTYRYDLHRVWNPQGSTICGWVMLNPSTADENALDPTLRRCMGFSRAWGYDGMVIRNLFALRATDPRQLVTAEDPVGPDNDEWLATTGEAWQGVHKVVVAWGTGRYPHLAGDRWRRAAELLGDLAPLCLGTAKDGHPLHPLYQPAALTPIPWKPVL